MTPKQYQEIQVQRNALLGTPYAVHKAYAGDPRRETRLRDLINRRITPTTEKDYSRRAKQFAAKKMEAEKSGKPLVFRTRTDLRNCAAAVMRSHLNTLAGITPYSDYQEALKQLDAAIKDRQIFLRNYKQDQGKRQRTEKQIGKLAALEKIRPDWRDTMDLAMRNSKHYPAYVVARATGCRPAELSHGIRIERAPDNPGEYLLYVHTAKERAETRDNRLRIIRSDDSRLEPLVGRVVMANLKSFSTMFRDYARASLGVEIWPRTLRYAMASDAAASGWSLTQQAELLGHANDKVAKTYVAGLNTKAGTRSRPATVEKARMQVKVIASKPMSNEAREHLRSRVKSVVAPRL